MKKVIFDRSSISGQVDLLKSSNILSCSDNDKIRIYCTPQLIDETYAHFINGATIAREEMHFLAGVFCKKIIDEPAEIFNKEIKEGRRDKNYIFCNKDKTNSIVLGVIDKLIKANTTPVQYDVFLREYKERADRRERFRKQIIKKRDSFFMDLKHQGKKLTVANRQSIRTELFSDYLIRQGEILIDVYFSDSLKKNEIKNAYKRNPEKYEYFHFFNNSFMETLYYYITNHHEVDANTQPDLEQLLYMKNLDILVTEEKGYLKDIFGILYKNTGKQIMCMNEFVSFLKTINGYSNSSKSLDARMG